MTEPAQPPYHVRKTMATPAEPVLASTIWLSHARDTTEPKEQLEHTPVERNRLSFNNKSLDSAFEGGLDYGAVHCLTSKPDSGASEVVQALIASHLGSSPEAAATVIDSTLSFDVRRLFTVLQAEQRGREEAIKMLDWLKIMKVFDYVGLTEAVAELRESLGAEQEEAKQPPPAPAKIFPSTIQDSEDEEDEMLDDISPAGRKASPPKAAFAPAPVSAKSEEKQPRKRLLVINNISQLVAPQLKNNYTQGQALLSSFTRSLRHLAQSHKICTILISNPSTKPAKEDETLSIFKSCTLRSALGIGIGHLVDVQLYLHTLPTQRGGHDMAHVLEIVQDREDGRSGTWAAFVCDVDGRLLDVS